MDLDSPVLSIPGVGPSYAKSLAQHGLTTVLDVIQFTPSRYVDFTDPQRVSSIRIGQMVTVSGEIIECRLERTKNRRMMIVRATLQDESGSIDAIWFNQAFLVKTLQKGTKVHLHGQVMFDGRASKVIRNPLISAGENVHPICFYSERSGLESGRFARVVRAVLPLVSDIEDPLPDFILRKYELLSRSEAFLCAHNPKSMKDVSRARERLAVDELWSIMTVMRLAKEGMFDEIAPNIKIRPDALEQDIVGLPFVLTSSQTKALQEIITDIAQKKPMRRLLNGDVGSGKTIIAFLVAKQVLRAKLKVVLLAPTLVLAHQHYQNWIGFDPSTPHFLFTGAGALLNGQKVSRKEALVALHQSGHAFVCGTHAVFHEDLGLSSGVGLVIVDEQHRFGVMQRAHITSKHQKWTPHLLSLSATPIPRTAALVLYGDLEISLLTEKPPGRIPIETRLASEKGRALIYRFIDQLIAKGEQVFVVCPLIKKEEDSFDFDGRLFELDERKAAVDEYEKLKQSIFAHRRIGLLHGRMKHEEKEIVLTQFRMGKLDILVATSVIEVGVDIANASVMIVEGAESFGLAQLHQLRGRIGRSSQQSYCFLFASEWSPKIKERLTMLVMYADGFTLAEKDLELRGPGELYGTLQAGISPFKYATLSNAGLVTQASRIAHDLLSINHADWSERLRLWIEMRQHTIHRE